MNGATPVKASGAEGSRTEKGGRRRTRPAPPPRIRRALCWCSDCWLLTGAAGFKASNFLFFTPLSKTPIYLPQTHDAPTAKEHTPI